MATTINAGRVRFVSRGTYNNSTQYYLFDLVDYNGSSYIAKENSLGNLPTNTQYWQLIAEKGNTGNTGATGPVGPTGNGISSITKTGTDGLVDTYTITYTDGTTSTFQVTNGEDAEITPEEFEELQNEVNELKDENQRLKATLPTTKGNGETITLNKTAEMEFVVPPLPEGNTVQDGEPTPTNPVEVQVVKGDVEVLIQNKNIAKIEDFKEYYTLDGNGLPVYTTVLNRVTNTTPINVKSFDNVIVSFKNNTSNTINFIYSLLDANNNLISRVAGNSSGLSINTSTAEYLYICFYDNVTLQSITEVQVEPNTTQSPYTPHKEQKLPLTLGNIELCKIGDYKDYFYKDNGKWYLHKEIGEVVLNGTENWTAAAAYTNNTRFTATDNRFNLGKTTKLISNYFIEGTGGTDTTNIDTNGNTGQLMLTILNNIATTTEGLAIWLSTHNTKIKYTLKKLIDIEITDTTLISQLEAINNAISYEGQTNISGTSSGINPLFDVEAYQSTKLLLENALDRLELLEN